MFSLFVDGDGYIGGCYFMTTAMYLKTDESGKAEIVYYLRSNHIGKPSSHGGGREVRRPTSDRGLRARHEFLC